MILDETNSGSYYTGYCYDDGRRCGFGSDGTVQGKVVLFLRVHGMPMPIVASVSDRGRRWQMQAGDLQKRFSESRVAFLRIR